MKRIVLLVLIATTALAGCGGDSTGPMAVATGHWFGTMQSTDVIGTTLSLQIVESGGMVTGTASLGGANVPKQLTVTGTYSPPNLSLIMSLGALTPSANLTGTIAGNSMTAVVNGSGFINDPITMARQ
jgi:hypothetical protein